LRKLNPSRNIKNVYVTVEDMVDYDLPNMKASINTDSLSKLKFLHSGEDSQNIQNLVKFSKWFLDLEKSFKTQNKLNPKNIGLYRKFIETLTEFFEAHEYHKTRPLDTAETSASAQKFCLLKLSLLYSSMDPSTTAVISSQLDFPSLLNSLKSEISESTPKDYAQINPRLDTSWMGVRLGVEVPQKGGMKDLGIEMVNRNFMWCDDYFHYDDWGNMMREGYDGFNLWVRNAEEKDGEKLYYQDGWRRCPKGIFPDGKGPRKLSFYNSKDEHKKLMLDKLDLQKHRNLEANLIGEHDKRAMIVEELLNSKNQLENGK
jgi:hypothetical protein